MPRMPAENGLEILTLTSERFPDLGKLFASGDPRWC
jgi:hypothetical protein